VVKSWSDAARAALDAYPWKNPREKAKAREEAELVAFGEQVEPDDLPLAVRRWTRTHAPKTDKGYVWHGETLEEATRAFEKAILSQALAANGGCRAKAARALGTTARIVDYKARKLGI